MNNIGFLREQKVKNKTKLPIVGHQHALCTGETGSGKTSSWANVNLQECIKNQHGILMYDFKGQEHLVAKKLAHENKQLHKVVEIGKADLSKSINIMKYLTLKGIRSVVSKIIGSDDMWVNGASDLYISTIEIIKISISLRELYLKKGIFVPFNTQVRFSSKGEAHERGFETFQQQYPKTLSFQSLNNVFKDFKSFIMFVEGSHDFIDNHRTSFKQYIYDNKDDNSKEFLDYTVLVIKQITELENAFSELDSYRGLSYKPERKSSGLYGLLMVLQSIKSLAEHDFLNHDEYDILEGLNNSDCVVINAALLSDSMLNILNKSILDELQRRTKQNTSSLRQISIFLDEAQRLSDRNSDFQIDVLRSSKVFLYFACQSELLMIQSMGESNYLALRVNITKKFHFRDNTRHEHKHLKTHEYCEDDEETVYQSQPLFFTENELLKIEVLYQRQLGLQKQYNLDTRKPEIIIFDEVLYEKSKEFVVLNIRTKKTYTISSMKTSHYSKKITVRDFLLAKSGDDELEDIKRVLTNACT